MGPFSPIVTAQFWSKVNVRREDTACWEWHGAFDGSGYGAFKVNGRDQRAHRIAFAMIHGSAPEDKPVLHQCDNPACCNPFHLRAGTQAENMIEMSRKGRARAGVATALKEAVLADAGPAREVALRHGVSTKTVVQLRNHAARRVA